MFEKIANMSKEAQLGIIVFVVLLICDVAYVPLLSNSTGWQKMSLYAILPAVTLSSTLIRWGQDTLMEMLLSKPTLFILTMAVIFVVSLFLGYDHSDGVDTILLCFATPLIARVFPIIPRRD